MTANIPLTIIIPAAAIGNYSHAGGSGSVGGGGGIGCTVGQNEVDPGGGDDGNVSPMAVGSNEDEDDHEAAAAAGQGVTIAANGMAPPAENGNLQGEL